MEKLVPDVIILSGPFVDREHPMISLGQVNMDEDEIFKTRIVPKLKRMKEIKPGVQIILLPSQKDSCLEWIAFPQVFLH